MPMIYRLWTKIRKVYIDEWEALHRGPWDAAVKGSSALRAAVLSMFHDELATLSEEEVAKILWDMEKFYDNIHIGLLIKRAEDLGYPSLIIALGLQMHVAPRILRAHEHHTFCELPSNGIIAGCTQSNIFARISYI